MNIFFLYLLTRLDFIGGAFLFISLLGLMLLVVCICLFEKAKEENKEETKRLERELSWAKPTLKDHPENKDNQKRVSKTELEIKEAALKFDKDTKLIKKGIRWLIVATVVFFSFFGLLPSTKQAIFVYVASKITNSEFAEKVASPEFADRIENLIDKVTK